MNKLMIIVRLLIRGPRVVKEVSELANALKATIDETRVSYLSATARGEPIREAELNETFKKLWKELDDVVSLAQEILHEES